MTILRDFNTIQLAGVLAFVPAMACSQSWIYQTYTLSGPATPGYITLEERNGEYFFSMVASRVENCYSSKLKAAVEKTSTTMIITPVPRMPGCEEARFVLKNDGSGGVKQIKSGEEWIPDGRDRNMSAKN